MNEILHSVNHDKLMFMSTTRENILLTTLETCVWVCVEMYVDCGDMCGDVC